MARPPATELAIARRRSRGGASIPELLIALALVGTIGGAAWRALDEIRDERTSREAARGVVADLRRTAQAARRARKAMAVEFQPPAPAHWRVLVDGNGNGITSSDITAGIDAPAASWTPVFREGAARLAVSRTVPDADGSGSIPAGSSPLRFGVMTRIVFTPHGTGTAGSIYVAGRGDRMYAIRVLGSTQRIRLLCLSATDAWEAC